MLQPVPKDKIKKAIGMSVPLTIRTYKLPHETEMYLDEILSVFLEEMGQSELKDRLSYILRELTVNAKKANTKRVFFEKYNLNILEKSDYERGMQNFKEQTLSNLDEYLELQKQKGLYIKVSFQAVGKKFIIGVRNNSEITRKEQMRIFDRIARSRAFTSMEEAFSEVLDDSEGAGLGIVIMILMLRKMGLDEDAFEIEGENGETISTITIPISEVHLENLDIMTRKIVEEIDALPHFPENIVQLQRMINDPDSEMISIARRISTDPTMTADILKLVNSAQYMLPNRVDNITEAVKMVGLKTLKNLLYSYGTEKILNLPNHKKLWEHAHRTAYYAYNLARNLRKFRDIVDDSYVGGILHDMGKIIFASVHPSLLDKIRDFAAGREIPSQLFEDLSAGYNHAEIGALIAEKWNFPEILIESIRYHHEPLNCGSQNRPVVYSIYLANCICEMEQDGLQYDQLVPEVLQFFNITSKEQMNQIQSRLNSSFIQEIESNIL